MIDAQIPTPEQLTRDPVISQVRGALTAVASVLTRAPEQDPGLAAFERWERDQAASAMIAGYVAQTDYDLRCPHHKHGRVLAGATGMIEVACRDCRDEPGHLAIHVFDLATGELIETRHERR